MAVLAQSLAALWTVCHSLLYGYQITSLNGIQTAVVCSTDAGAGRSGENGKLGLRTCLDLDDSTFGVAVTMLTIGGLLGSISGDTLTRVLGRTGVFRTSEMIFIAGAILIGLSNNLAMLIIGRILVGMASGLVLVTVPLHLAEIAPKRLRTLFGTLHQLSIGVGMLVAQALSVPLGKPFVWRYVPAIGALIGVVLFLSGLVLGRVEGKDHENHGATSYGDEEDENDEERPLLGEDDDSQKAMSVRELFTTEDAHVRKTLLVVVVAQASQQICGISPVMYFSTRILSSVFQLDSSKLVALSIMAIGIPFNFVPGLVPEVGSAAITAIGFGFYNTSTASTLSLGTKSLLLLSSALTSLFSFALALSLNAHKPILSATSVFAFVIAFSIGLAPLAWVVLSEVMPKKARTAGGSVGVGVNWLVNFAAGSSFLPLQQFLKRGDEGEGNVFFIFSIASAVAFIAIWRSYALLEK